MKLSCSLDSGNLYFDLEESRNNGLAIIYTCERCGCMYSLTKIGTKEPGWKTKEKLKHKELIETIPF